jgi:hypothetical protein
VNLKISPLRASTPDTNRFCAEAVVQIRITAPKAAILLTKPPASLEAGFDLVSVSLVFIIVSFVSFLVGLSFHRGTAENAARYNVEIASHFKLFVEA